MLTWDTSATAALGDELGSELFGAVSWAEAIADRSTVRVVVSLRRRQRSDHSAVRLVLQGIVACSVRWLLGATIWVIVVEQGGCGCRYLIAEANYGGRVTDELDRRVLASYLNKFYCEDVLAVPHYQLSPLPTYVVPPPGPLSSFKDYIAGLPAVDPPEAFGQHANAEISYLIEDSKVLPLSAQRRSLGWVRSAAGIHTARQFDGRWTSPARTRSGSA